jgi:conjugative transfer signal peptidase TraF
MPEARHSVLARWGEELRRDRQAQRAGRQRLAAAAAAGFMAAALCATLLWPPRPLLLWNGSASVPIGLYRIGSPGMISRGDSVAAWPPENARRLASDRHYLPSGVPLVKRVAGVAGDRICAIGEAVFLNGDVLAFRLAEDRLGRPLPWWTGCRDLQQGDLFLLMPAVPGSFDGRYFGVTAKNNVIGRASLLWAR